MDVHQVRSDLLAEQGSLDALVSGLDPIWFGRPSPSPRWSVGDQIAHLAYFDRAAAVAISDPVRFGDLAQELLEQRGSGEEVDDLTLGRYRSLSPDELLVAWREDRAHLAEASAKLEDDSRVIWYGPSMGAKSFLTARLMECFVHGQDIADAVGVDREPSDRIRHIATLGFITRSWSYASRGLEPPAAPVRVSLIAPSGDTWEFGDPDAPQSISGPAADFCLVVAQRRHVDDTALVVDGHDARDWMLKAQIFAGPATDGPEPTG